jgi:hypothetical protein
MPLGIWFYLILFLWAVFGAWWGWADASQRVGRLGGMLLPWLALLILGISVFGSPIKGG